MRIASKDFYICSLNPIWFSQMHQRNFAQISVRWFSQWSRKAYAIFMSISRVVHIGSLKIDTSDQSLLKTNRLTLVAAVQPNDKEEDYPADEPEFLLSGTKSGRAFGRCQAIPAFVQPLREVAAEAVYSLNSLIFNPYRNLYFPAFPGNTGFLFLKTSEHDQTRIA